MIFLHIIEIYKGAEKYSGSFLDWSCNKQAMMILLSTSYEIIDYNKCTVFDHISGNIPIRS